MEWISPSYTQNERDRLSYFMNWGLNNGQIANSLHNGENGV